MRIKIGKKSYRPSEIRKALVVLGGMTVELGNQAAEQFANAPSFIHSAITVVVGLGTIVGTFLVRNANVIDGTDFLE